MTKLRAFPVVALTVLLGAPAIGSEPMKLKCEEWHPRLGQNPDRLFAIDVDAKTCNGQPCSMSDAEFKWQEQNGRYETTINRRSGDGTLVYQGALLVSYKNCAPISLTRVHTHEAVHENMEASQIASPARRRIAATQLETPWTR